MLRLWPQSLLALLCCLTIFSFMLGTRPLNSPDETRYSSVSVEMVRNHDYITPRVNGIKFLDKPILFYWLQASSIRLFGIHNWSLRLISALFACLGCLAIFLLATKIYDSKTAWLSLLFLSSSPLYFISAHYINMDMMIAVLITLCLSCFYTAFITDKKHQRKLLLYGFYIFAALGFLTKGLIGFVLPVLVVLVWMIWQRQWSVLKWIFSPIGIILFLLITLPWYIAVQHANPEFFHYFFIFEQFDRFSQAGFNNMMPWWFYLPIIFVFLFPWSFLLVLILIYAIKQRVFIPHHAFLISWILVVLVFFSIPHSKIISYIVPIFPPLILLLTSYLPRIQPKKLLLTFNTIGYLIITLALLVSLHWYEAYQPFIASKNYFYAIIGLMAVMTLISFTLLLKQKWFTQLIMTAISTIFLFWLLLLAVQWPPLEIQPIMQKLQTVIKPTDKLVTFDIYPYALPIYLNHPVITVANWNEISMQDDNWKGHFWYGATPTQKQQLLLTPTQFWQIWNSTDRVYVIMTLDMYNKFNLAHVILKTKNEILVVNN